MSISCPKCYQETQVIDSRDTAKSFSDPNWMVRRRRKCKECGYRFTTFEVSETLINKLFEIEKQRHVISAYLNGESAQSSKLTKKNVGIVKALGRLESTNTP